MGFTHYSPTENTGFREVYNKKYVKNRAAPTVQVQTSSQNLANAFSALVFYLSSYLMATVQYDLLSFTID